MTDLRRPFDEFERIANNRPHPSIDSSLPKYTDGTTAGFVRKTPRRIVQQIPNGIVDVREDEGLSCLADYLLQNEIIPNSKAQDSVIGKSWKTIENALIYGSSDALIFYTVNGDYFGTDWKIPYKKDVFLETGKGTFQESNYIFVRAWYTTPDLEALIEKEKKLEKAAKKRKEKYTATWDYALLEKLKDKIKPKEASAQTDSEKELSIKKEGAEIIHCYQNGIGAEFYSYSTDLDEVVRTWANPDPRGVMPLARMYYETDLSNPEGRGIVELVGPTQNFIDSTQQSYAYMRALMMNPPLTKRGNIPNSAIRFVPNAIIDLGNDPNAKIEPLQINTQAMSNFSQDFGLWKSQILNLASGGDTTTSSTVGNPGFSKTSAGVAAQQEKMGVDDNYITKRYEAFIEEVFITQLNIYFAVTQGDRTFTVDEEALQKLTKYESPYFTVDGNTITVHFSEINDKVFDFKVEASTSKATSDDETKEKTLELIDTLAKYGLLQLTDTHELIKRYINLTGLEDPEKIVPDQQEQGIDPQTGQPIAMQDPSMQAPQEQMQDAGQEMPQEDQEITPEEEQIFQNLVQAGYPPELAIKGIELERQGLHPDQIDQILKGAQ